MSVLSISMAVFNLQICLCHYMMMAHCINNAYPDFFMHNPASWLAFTPFQSVSLKIALGKAVLKVVAEDFTSKTNRGVNPVKALHWAARPV